MCSSVTNFLLPILGKNLLLSCWVVDEWIVGQPSQGSMLKLFQSPEEMSPPFTCSFLHAFLPSHAIGFCARLCVAEKPACLFLFFPFAYHPLVHAQFHKDVLCVVGSKAGGNPPFAETRVEQSRPGRTRKVPFLSRLPCFP